jgi:glucan phosphoethanolaminetransferase (alkaline phosphatase superfamily)
MQKIVSFYLKKILPWYALLALFLWIYIDKFHQPYSAIGPHFYIANLGIFALFLFNTLICRIIRFEKLARCLISLIFGTILFVVLIYYGTVFISLSYWNRVVSEELIVSYAKQPLQLLETIEVSYEFVLLGTISLYLVLVTAIHFFYDDFHAGSRFIGNFSANLVNGLLLCAITLCVFYLYDYSTGTDLSAKEPFRLTLQTGKLRSINPKSQSALGKVNANEKFDRLEDIEKLSYQATKDARLKNVVLIIVDALRPDHMGVYGYPRDTTPYLNSLEKLGHLSKFKHVRATCSESSCGIASIASSRYTHLLPSNPLNLQQVLQRYGYETHMILGGDHTNFYNLRDFYGPVTSYSDGSTAGKYYMNDDSLIIERVKSLPPWNQKPMMLQVHLMSAHILGKRLGQFEKFAPHKNYTKDTPRSPGLPQTNHYDNGVLQADAMIQQILEMLKEKSYLDNAIVVITSDHGEGLGEHGYFSHANNVFDEVMRVPLLLSHFKDGSILNSKENSLFSQIDIAPTILHDLGMPKPKTWLGQAIQTATLQTIEKRKVYFQIHPYIGFYSLEKPDELWKYWINTNTRDEYAFNLNADPKELNNLVWQIPIQTRDAWRTLAYSTQIK